MPNINFNIVSGTAPFEVELIGSSIPALSFNSTGQQSITDVPNGVYALRITDANGCLYEKEMIVDPNVTTTTTTTIPGNSIVVGHAQDPLLIFNPDGTNRNGDFSGYPDPDIVTLYLWFKTFNGKPLAGDRVLTYNIDANDGSEFEFNKLSDQIHTEVIEDASGPADPISGSIILRAGFIESFFEYTYYRGNVNKRFQIDIQSPLGELYPNSETNGDAGTTYGITSINTGQIILDY